MEKGTGLYSPLRRELEPFLKKMQGEAVDSSIQAHHNYVDTIYKSFIDELSGGKKHARNVLQHVVEKVLDSGLARSHKFDDSNEETPPIAEAVPMLNRQAMLYQVKRKSGLERDEQGKFKIGQDKQIHALTLDLKRFRKADEAGAGDYDLNIIAAAIKNAEKEIAIFGVDKNDIVVGRYGGDEFYVFIVGKTANGYSNKIDAIKDIIRKNVTAAKGYFGKNEASVHFAIKHNTVEAIEVPSDTEENREKRQKFLEFIDKNSILDPQQLEKEVAYERENPLTQEERERKKIKGIYPDEIESLTDSEAKVTAKIEYLINSNPDLKIPYWYALAKDKKDKKKIQVLRTSRKMSARSLIFIKKY